MRDPYIAALLNRYGDLLDDCDRFRDLGWYPTAEVVDRFADHLFGGIGYESPDFWVPRDAFGLDVHGKRRPDISEAEFKRFENIVAAADRVCRVVAETYLHRFKDYLTLINEPCDFGASGSR